MVRRIKFVLLLFQIPISIHLLDSGNKLKCPELFYLLRISGLPSSKVAGKTGIRQIIFIYFYILLVKSYGSYINCWCLCNKCWSEKHGIYFVTSEDFTQRIFFSLYMSVYMCVCTHIYNPSMQPKLFLYHTPTTTYHVFYGNILNLYNSLVLWKWCLILKILKHPQEKKKRKKSWYHV